MKEINYKYLPENAKVRQIKGLRRAKWAPFSQAYTPKRCNCMACKRLRVRRTAKAR